MKLTCTYFTYLMYVTYGEALARFVLVWSFAIRLPYLGIGRSQQRLQLWEAVGALMCTCEYKELCM